MKIFVCLKAVPDTETKIKIAADKTSADLSAVKWVMNPYDEFAVEESIKIRDANPGSNIVVVSLGSKKSATEPLRTALAMGADEAILIDGAETNEPLFAAQALAKLIQQEGGFSLLLTGKMAIDDNASSVPQMIAEFLNIPHVTVVSKLTISGEKAAAERDVEGGSKEIVELPLPCVVAANKGLNMPRYASLPGIMKAKKKVIKEVAVASLGITDGPRTKVVSMELPPEKSPAKILSGDIKSQVSALVKSLRDEAKVL